ncbi:PspC domain-containing protein [Williamsia soli]|uniref:PspC domain-containing protein n=1 Tax=Williamsia soli TaxID=364929 RepID=UPI001A9DA2F3|nr:PspC domain-containing protein [Williamsia soli]
MTNTEHQDTKSGSPFNSDELHNIWRTRPARAAAGSSIAGVATGIGLRYKVDPTLVKVAFIVSALFGGAGILIYIAAWILLPEGSASAGAAAQDTHANRLFHGFRHASSHPPTIVGIVIVVVVALVAGPHLAWSSGGVAGLALMALGWWLLYQRTPVAEPGTSADTVGQRPVAQSTAPGSWWQQTTGASDDSGQFQRWTPRAWLKEEAASNDSTGTGTEGATDPTQGSQDPLVPTPPAWDPLGAAPFAWDLPEPTQPAEIDAHPRSRFTPIVLGLTVIATGVAAAISVGTEWLDPVKVASIGLAVVAAGLLVGAFLRRGAGLIPVAIAMAGFVVVASLIDGMPSGPVGDRDWKPLTSADIRDEYTLMMGSGELDLTAVDLTADKKVVIDLGVGEFKVIAPKDMNLRTTCDAAIGEAKCPDGLDGGTDGTAGPVLTIDADTTIGNAEVIRE